MAKIHLGEVHGFSNIRNVKKFGKFWRFKINYVDNLLLCLRQADFFMIRTMAVNFLMMLLKPIANRLR